MYNFYTISVILFLMYFYLNSIFYFYLNYFTFPILWLRISLWNLFTPKILCTPSHSTFVTPNTKIVFFFIISSKNKCWQNLPEIIFGIHQILFQIFGTPWDLLGPKWSKKKHIWSVVYQNRVKRVHGFHFWRNLWKIFKNKCFGVEIFQKGQILRSFLMVAYLEYSIHQF